jgi:hypothetical protein
MAFFLFWPLQGLRGETPSARSAAAGTAQAETVKRSGRHSLYYSGKRNFPGKAENLPAGAGRIWAIGLRKMSVRESRKGGLMNTRGFKQRLQNAK